MFTNVVLFLSCGYDLCQSHLFQLIYSIVSCELVSYSLSNACTQAVDPCSVLKQLPEPNRVLLEYIIVFLQRLCTPQAVAEVINSLFHILNSLDVNECR